MRTAHDTELYETDERQCLVITNLLRIRRSEKGTTVFLRRFIGPKAARLQTRDRMRTGNVL